MLDQTRPLFDQLDQPDPRREVAIARQTAVWEGREPDYLPLLAEAAGQPWDGEEFTLAEQAADADKMLHEALLGASPLLPVQSDSILSIRPQFGVGLLATPFGVEYELSARYGSPWVRKPVSKETLAAMEPTDIRLEESLVGRACEFLRHFRRELGDRLAIYLPDTQGPFDIAHQVRGHDIFTDLYDDPPFVHHLMELATTVYIEATRALKEALGEPLSSGHHGGALVMATGGVRMCDDSGVLMPPKAIAEFVTPYHQRALQPFGGGWVHWCGNAPQLFEAYVPLPEVKAINFGQPEFYDPARVLPRLREAGKAYFGSWPRLPGEETDAYFDRLLGLLGGEKRGLLLQPAGDGSPPAELMSRWHEAHARVFG